MELGLQAKLLRVIQEKEVERLGSQRKIKLNVRILATTNRQLKFYVQDGLFREDLYYRLNVFPLRIPALVERVDDILPLANDLLQRHCVKGNKLPSFSPKAAKKLQAYHWPGNVRELENVVQRALILQSGTKITEQDLVFEEMLQEDVLAETASDNTDGSAMAIEPVELEATESEAESLGCELRSAEDKIILSTLQALQGSRKMTAEKLGISPRTLRYKIARMKDDGVCIPC
jgi:two-component system response regulator FlrC